jgi:hypothetical protein
MAILMNSITNLLESGLKASDGRSGRNFLAYTEWGISVSLPKVGVAVLSTVLSDFSDFM